MEKNTFEWWSKQWLVVFDEGWPLRAEYLRIVMAHSSSSYHWNNIAVRVRTLLTFPLQLSNENGLTLVGVLLVFYACTFSTACLSCQKCAVKCFQQAAVSGQFVDVRKAPCTDSCMLHQPAVCCILCIASIHSSLPGALLASFRIVRERCETFEFLCKAIGSNGHGIYGKAILSAKRGSKIPLALPLCF